MSRTFLATKEIFMGTSASIYATSIFVDVQVGGVRRNAQIFELIFVDGRGVTIFGPLGKAKIGSGGIMKMLAKVDKRGLITIDRRVPRESKAKGVRYRILFIGGDAPRRSPPGWLPVRLE